MLENIHIWLKRRHSLPSHLHTIMSSCSRHSANRRSRRCVHVQINSLPPTPFVRPCGRWVLL